MVTTIYLLVYTILLFGSGYLGWFYGKKSDVSSYGDDKDEVLSITFGVINFFTIFLAITLGFTVSFTERRVLSPDECDSYSISKGMAVDYIF